MRVGSGEVVAGHEVGDDHVFFDVAGGSDLVTGYLQMICSQEGQTGTTDFLGCGSSSS